MELKTQPNEKRCRRMVETHILDLPPCCPVSGNPLGGSTVEIQYEPNDTLLEVASLLHYINSYQGGKGDLRSMEGMIQQITQDVANRIEARVYVTARLNIHPQQKMLLECSAYPKDDLYQ